MKTSYSLIKQKVSIAVKTHFDKNPNDIIPLSFGAIVLAFILLITPHIPQTSTSSSTFTSQPKIEQEFIRQINTDLVKGSTNNEDKVVLNASLK
ncbi:MAG: hypothetical protein U5K71_08470 [Gracilimonas sp.]|nr:hypothetical protein [Gracilimonas sp.]